ncbi:YbfB/YjiJ family MFS transporter [Desulfuromonas carbonis]
MRSTLPANRSSAERDALKILLGGMLGMVVAMGIGRFAFTPVLPLMQRDLPLSNTLAGWLAGLNYLGYLAGAVGCSLYPRLLRIPLITGGALVASIATTLLMGVGKSPLWWGAMRLGGGVASAILFIVISAEVVEALTRRGFGHWIGALYGGIGIGIALSGLAVPLLDQLGGWSGSWLGLGLLAALCATVGLRLGRQGNLVQVLAQGSAPTLGGPKSLWLLAGSYFFQGLGYIVTATFIVAIIAVTPGLAAFSPYSWVATGIAALPSTILWPRLARRIGTKQALLCAYLLQAAGIFVSIGATSIGAVLFAAVSFGGTFLGIVALTLAEGNRRSPADGRRATAILTVCFSLGQILGPVLAGTLADRSDGFTLPLGLATGCVLLGAFLVLIDRNYL